MTKRPAKHQTYDHSRNPRPPIQCAQSSSTAAFCKHLNPKKGADSSSLYALTRPLTYATKHYCFVSVTVVTLSDNRAASYVMLCDELANTPPGGVILTLNIQLSHRSLLRSCGILLPANRNPNT